MPTQSRLKSKFSFHNFQISLTRLAVHANHSGNLKDLEAGSILLPRIQLIAIGIPYETPRATTEAEIIALNALLEPRKMQPKIRTRPTVR